MGMPRTRTTTKRNSYTAPSYGRPGGNQPQARHRAPLRGPVGQTDLAFRDRFLALVESVLGVAERFLGLALELIAMAFGLGRAVAGRPADLLLDLALDLV